MDPIRVEMWEVLPAEGVPPFSHRSSLCDSEPLLIELVIKSWGVAGPAGCGDEDI
jgi:hypothetical protein